MQAGVGLKNVRDRLLLTYGNTATLALFDAEAGGAIADLRFPS
jgi:sensor histidine kinase YesM